MTPTRAVTPRPALARRLFLGRMLAALAGALLPWRVGRARADDQGLATYLGEIKLFACTFAPRNWALCNGQLLPIAQNQALFALLGTQYGGNGQTSFALPDLRGRVAIHHGQGPGLSAYSIGQMAGEENHTLTPGELPAHSHVARASSAVGSSASPVTLLPARNAAEVPQYAASPDTTLAAGAISSVGGSQAHPNMQPHLALNYCIALSGIFPTP
jgi:microcystin-dependent protein